MSEDEVYRLYLEENDDYDDLGIDPWDEKARAIITDTFRYATFSLLIQTKDAFKPITDKLKDIGRL